MPGVEIFEFLESEMAPQTGRDIQSHVGRFDHDRGAAAHGIEKRNFRRPPGETKNPCSEIFPERRLARRQAPAALKQRFPGRVEIERNIAIRQMGLDRNIRRACIDAGAAARDSADLVAHRVLNLQCDEVEACEGTLGRRDIDPDRAHGVEPIAPRKRIGSAINIVFALVTTVCHLPQNPAGNAAFEIDPVGKKKITGELNAAADRMDLFGFERAQLIGEKQLQTARAGGKESLHDGSVMLLSRGKKKGNRIGCPFS